MKEAIFDALVRLLAPVPLVLGTVASAEAQTYTFETQAKEIDRVSKIIPIPEFGAFGDGTEYFSGTTTFRKTLVSVPGNNDLRVAADYIVKLDDRPGGRPMYVLERDLPYIEGRHSSEHGWVVGYVPSNFNFNRCSDSRSLFNGAATVAIRKPIDNIVPADYHDGNSLYTPGAGGGLFRPISAEELRPIGVDVKWATNDGWRFSCYTLPDGTEGFVGHRTNGEKYYFGIPVARGHNLQILSPNKPDVDGWLDVDKFRMYVTRIEDRFGNWVNYEDGRIFGSDGRIITFTPSTSVGMIVRANEKQWTISGGISNWTGSYSIANPDGSTWNFSIPSNTAYPTFSKLENSCSRESMIPLAYSGEMTVVVTTESGARGEFIFRPRRRGFSFVSTQCYVIGAGSKEGGFYSKNMHFIDGMSLISRTVSGPGLSTYSHVIDYGAINGCYVTDWTPNLPDPCVANSPTTRTVTITSSDGRVRALTYGNKFGDNAGLLLSEMEDGLKSTSFEHVRLYENYGGGGNRELSYAVGSYAVLGTRKKTISMQGKSFITEVPATCGSAGASLCFDEYFRPTKVVRSSTP